MLNITGKDIYFARNQPYGYWRVGNPIVKGFGIILMVIGAFSINPSLIIQSAIVIGIMLWAPFNPKSMFQIIIMNFGFGIIFVSMLNPTIFPYDRLDNTTSIPYIANINWLTIISMFIMMFALYSIVRAITSRDCIWFVTLIPNSLSRRHIGAITYSFIYGFMRFRHIVLDLDITIRGRGGYRPYAFKTMKTMNTFVDNFAYWFDGLLREMEEMRKIIQFVLISRIKITRRITPIARAWSPTDFCIMGIMVFGIILPRFLPLQKVLIP